MRICVVQRISDGMKECEGDGCQRKSEAVEKECIGDAAVAWQQYSSGDSKNGAHKKYKCSVRLPCGNLCSMEKYQNSTLLLRITSLPHQAKGVMQLYFPCT